MHSKLVKTIVAAALLGASVAFGVPVEKSAAALPEAPRGAAPKARCTAKSCGRKVVEALKGATETTRLPETARFDARGGVFL